MNGSSDVDARAARPPRRRWRLRLLAGLIALGFVLYYVPVVPYTPSCSFDESLKGKTSNQFRSEVASMMIYFDRTFLVVDDVMLHRLTDWADWSRLPRFGGDIMLNVNNKAIRSVIRDRQGVPLNPITVSPEGPATEAEFKALLDQATDCEIARQFVILPHNRG